MPCPDCGAGSGERCDRLKGGSFFPYLAHQGRYRAQNRAFPSASTRDIGGVRLGARSSRREPHQTGPMRISSRTVALSAACRRRLHQNCTALRCVCECHPDPRQKAVRAAA